MVSCLILKSIFKITKLFGFDVLFSIIRCIYSTNAVDLRISVIDFISQTVKNKPPQVEMICPDY